MMGKIVSEKFFSVPVFIIVFCIVALGGLVRFYGIDANPPGLYIDEVSSGYNGYTILTKGIDEYGTPYPLWFPAFGEYKMPGLIYSIAVSMALFGKNEFAVRFPSAFLGTGTILICFFLVRKLMELDTPLFKKINKNSVALLSAFLLAISPWHIHFSRGGFDATLACFLYFLAILLGLLFWKTKKRWYFFSSIFFFALTLYTYNAYRIVTPITILTFLFFLFKQKVISSKLLGISCSFLGILVLPVILFSLSSHGITRFDQTSAFAEYPTSGIVEKLLLYPIIFLRNYSSYFSFHFLFSFGDGIGRHQLPGFGVLSRWELPFLLLGLFYSVSLRKTKLIKVIVFLLFVIPLAGAIARPSPHSLRSLPLVLPYIVIISIGIIALFQKIHGMKRQILRVAVIGIVFIEMMIYMHAYYVHYPRVNVLDWGAANKEVVLSTMQMRKQYDAIVVDQNFAFIKEYFLFYDDSLQPLFVDVSWTKPTSWAKKNVLYIRRYYGPTTDPHIIKNIYLPTLNHDTYAQFWKI